MRDKSAAEPATKTARYVATTASSGAPTVFNTPSTCKGIQQFVKVFLDRVGKTTRKPTHDERKTQHASRRK